MRYYYRRTTINKNNIIHIMRLYSYGVCYVIQWSALMVYNILYTLNNVILFNGLMHIIRICVFEILLPQNDDGLLHIIRI